MLITCSNKGCFKTTEAKIDRDTMDVYCDECGKVIENLSDFIKKALVSSGQVLRFAKKKAFQVFCNNCKQNVDVSLVDGGKGGAVCSKCGNDLKLSQSFLQSIVLMNEDKDEDGQEQ